MNIAIGIIVGLAFIVGAYLLLRDTTKATGSNGGGSQDDPKDPRKH
jgi:hypothetical protein